MNHFVLATGARIALLSLFPVIGVARTQDAGPAPVKDTVVINFAGPSTNGRLMPQLVEGSRLMGKPALTESDKNGANYTKLLTVLAPGDRLDLSLHAPAELVGSTLVANWKLVDIRKETVFLFFKKTVKRFDPQDAVLPRLLTLGDQVDVQITIRYRDNTIHGPFNLAKNQLPKGYRARATCNVELKLVTVGDAVVAVERAANDVEKQALRDKADAAKVAGQYEEVEHDERSMKAMPGNVGDLRVRASVSREQ